MNISKAIKRSPEKNQEDCVSALNLLNQLYKGKRLEAKSQVVGHKPVGSNIEMICDCDGDGECCGY